MVAKIHYAKKVDFRLSGSEVRTPSQLWPSFLLTWRLACSLWLLLARTNAALASIDRPIARAFVAICMWPSNASEEIGTHQPVVAKCSASRASRSLQVLRTETSPSAASSTDPFMLFGVQDDVATDQNINIDHRTAQHPLYATL